jgi:hypothetical protein
LHVFLEVRINSRDLLHAFLSLSEPFIFNIELGLSQMCPTVPGLIPDKSRAFFECPCLPVDSGVLGIDSGGDVLAGGASQGIQHRLGIRIHDCSFFVLGLCHWLDWQCWHGYWWFGHSCGLFC